MLKDFPNIYYDLGEGKGILLKDLYFKLEFFFQQYQQNRNFFTKYMISDHETPESISLDKYNSKKYWFIILLLNNRTDPFYDWIIANDDLYDYAEKFVLENHDKVTQYVAQNISILENMSELMGVTLTSYSPINPTDKTDMFVKHMIDRYYTILNDENNEKRLIYLPTQQLMMRIYNSFIKHVNDL